MAENTPNYQLIKPLEEDFYSIEDFNGNSDIVDAELKKLADGKADKTNATQAAAGLMSAADKSKLDGVAAGANNYAHPANHPPGIISQDAGSRFVSDTEKAAWNGKAAGAHTHTASEAGAEPARTTATQAEAEAGTSTTVRAWTPQRVRQAVTASPIGKSNPNLLINHDFRNPVNQRGVPRSGTANLPAGYFLDRWVRAGGGTVYCTANGIYMTNGAQIIQRLPTRVGTNVFPSVEFYSGSAATAAYDNAAANWAAFTITATGTVTISRAKLELGNVSTLANEPPQNYGVEQDKCQRYYQVLTRDILGFGYTIANMCYFMIPTGTTMRTTPELVRTSYAGDITIRANGGSHQTGSWLNINILRSGSNGVFAEFPGAFPAGGHAAMLHTGNSTFALDAEL